MNGLGPYKGKFAPSGLRVFERAVEASLLNRQNYVSFAHLLQSLTVEDAKSLFDALRGLRAEPPLTEELIGNAVLGGPNWKGGGVRLSGQVISLLRQARSVARADGREKVEAADLISALARGVKAGTSAVFLRVRPPHSSTVRG